MYGAYNLHFLNIMMSSIQRKCHTEEVKDGSRLLTVIYLYHHHYYYFFFLLLFFFFGFLTQRLTMYPMLPPSLSPLPKSWAYRCAPQHLFCFSVSLSVSRGADEASPSLSPLQPLPGLPLPSAAQNFFSS